MRVARGCAFLFTTRNLDLAVQAQAQAIAMDRMKADEAVQLLSAGISPAPSQDQKSALGAIATRLGHWPLLLELANAALRRRAIRLLHQKGMSISDELLLHLSPLGREHINLTGDYVWHANRRGLRKFASVHLGKDLGLITEGFEPEHGFSNSLRFAVKLKVDPKSIAETRHLESARTQCLG
jgi:Tn3 transposase DDE domain